MQRPGGETGCPFRDHRGFCVTKESRARGLGRGPVEALPVSSTRSWTPDGDPSRAWQVVNQLGFVARLLRDSGDGKQEALDSAIPGVQSSSLEKEQWGAGKAF